MKHLSILYCFFFLLTGCKEQKKDGPQNKPAVIVQKDTRSADTSLAGDFSSQSSVKFEPVQLDRFFIRYPSARRFKKDITEFYARRHYAFAWYDANGQIEHGGKGQCDIAPGRDVTHFDVFLFCGKSVVGAGVGADTKNGLVSPAEAGRLYCMAEIIPSVARSR
jgi:uncharacterized protein YcfL